MAGFFRWLRFRREASGLAASDHLSRPQWVILESIGSPAMGSLYIQVLRRAGIPVLAQEWGAGAGAMGGALTGLRLLVPEDRLDEARETLGLGSAGSEVR